MRTLVCCLVVILGQIVLPGGTSHAQEEIIAEQVAAFKLERTVGLQDLQVLKRCIAAHIVRAVWCGHASIVMQIVLGCRLGADCSRLLAAKQTLDDGRTARIAPNVRSCS